MPRRRVAPDYATDLSIQILDRGRNAKRKGDRLLDHVYTVFMCRPNYYYFYYMEGKTLLLFYYKLIEVIHLTLMFNLMVSL